MAGEYNFTFYAGRQIDRTLIWKRDGVPVPMPEGWTALMQCRDRAGGRIMVTFETGNGTIILGTEDGTIRLLRDEDETGFVGWQHGVYELVLSKPDGQDLEPLLRGRFEVVPAINEVLPG